MAESPNHYAVLGLTRTFDEQQLKRQYRLLALKYHPDRNRGNEDEASRHFKLIAEAHAVLGDPKARRAYDLEQLKQMALNRRRPQPGARSHQYPPQRQHAAPPPVPPPVAAAAAAAKARAAHQQASARQAAHAAAAAVQPPPLPQRPGQPPPLPPSAQSGDPGVAGGGGAGDGGPSVSEEWDGMDVALEVSQAEAHAAEMAAIASEEAEIAAAVQEAEQQGQSGPLAAAQLGACASSGRAWRCGRWRLPPSLIPNPHPSPSPSPSPSPNRALPLTLTRWRRPSGGRRPRGRGRRRWVLLLYQMSIYPSIYLAL